MTLVHDFEGHTLHTLDFGGHPAWLAREVGAIAGYAARGQRLVKKIRGPWRDELIEAEDYLYLTSPPDDVRTHLDLGDHPMVLFRPGIDTILAKSCKHSGKRLRRFIVQAVLPSWHPEEPVPTAPPALQPGDSTDPDVLRECRLRDKLDYEDRRFRSSALSKANRILRDLGRIDDQTFAFTELMATQIALGVDLPAGVVDRLMVTP